MDQRKSALVRIVLRAAGLLFGVIVLGLIADKLYIETAIGKYCLYNGKDAACRFGLACGALSLIIAVVFILLDVLVDVTGTLKEQRLVVIATSSALSLIMAILWLSCFSYLTKLWVDVKGNDAPDKYKEPGDATLAFSFLSIPVWVAVAIVGILSLRTSVSS